jgi:hypothetical protein
LARRNVHILDGRVSNGVPDLKLTHAAST